jgi:alpha-galactosidase
MKAGLATLAALAAATNLAGATTVSPQELAVSHAWVLEKILGQAAEVPGPGLIVLANNDPVQLNARNGRPMRIVDREFTRGLYCHAVSEVVVRLPGPAKTLSALIGVDSNEQTRPGRGSVVFSVSAAGREAFRSQVTHEGMAAVPIRVDLAGAREFVLEVGDAGDGIACDQSDWAEAKVEMADGTSLWLGDLPMLETRELGANLAGPLFSFTYDGKPSAELLPTWQREARSEAMDENRTRHTVTWKDPATGLEVRLVAVECHDFATVEWTMYFRNAGAADTPILERILPLDTGWRRGSGSEFLLHHNVGSPANGSDFGPLQTPLGPKATLHLAAAGGRSTNSDMSYFNLQWGDEGRIIAVGWPGQWASDWVRDAGVGLRLQAGQELTHLKLLPGEEIRTPLIVVQSWKGGDWIRAQNLWRRWVMAHSIVRPDGELPKPAFRAASSRAYQEMIGANEANQIMHIDRYEEEKLGLDTWWMDAGWYVQDHGWPQVGTWEVDTKRFPQGLKPISYHAHEKGINILVWFEPERVAADTWLARNHPEWILGGARGGLLDLGNPEAWKWLIEHVDELIRDNGIDIYRQDFNMDPLAYWRGKDAPDRQGITEIRHIEGLLAYWDELRRRHPGMLIDTCASGGRRVDLETLRRAVPLWRSDYAFEPIGHQGMTYGISMWIPYHGTGTVACSNAGYYGGGKTPVEPYAFWSNVAPSISCGMDIRVREIDWAAMRNLVSQWRQISPCYYGDYYPLTPYSRDDTQWIGWQFDVPERGEGVVQVFRRPKSPYESARFPLQGLDPVLTYEVTDLTTGLAKRLSGKELLESGLQVALSERPEAAVLRYKALSAGK